MAKQNYTQEEVKSKIQNAIDSEHKNSEFYCSMNPGKPTEERRAIENYVCGALVALMYEF